jgi:hypothetical protein
MSEQARGRYPHNDYMSLSQTSLKILDIKKGGENLLIK